MASFMKAVPGRCQVHEAFAAFAVTVGFGELAWPFVRRRLGGRGADHVETF